MAQTVNDTDLRFAQRTGDSPDATRALSVYLNDHLAAATAGVRLAHRLVRHQRHPAAVRELTKLAAEVDEDREALLRLMGELGIPARGLRVLGGVLGEHISRLKTHGRLLRRSRLRPVVELETMLIGIQGKAALWRLLGTLPEVDRGSRAEELSGLLGRADRQTETVELLREEAAIRAMAGAPCPPAVDGLGR